MLNIPLFIAGDWHYYQKRTLAILSLNVFVISIIQLSLIYTLAVPQLICDGELCKQVCQVENVDKDFGKENIITSFDLYCENQIYILYLYTSFFIGQAIGSIFLGQIGVLLTDQQQDRCGRKFTKSISQILSILGIWNLVLSQEFNQLLFSHFISGFSIVGIYIQTVVIINEQFSYVKKQSSMIIILIVWAFGALFSAIIFYFINWQQAYIYFCLIPQIILLSLSWYYIYESPVHLQSIGNFMEALSVYNQISQLNKRSQVLEQDLQQNLQENELNLSHLFVLKEYRIQLIGLSLTGFHLALFQFAILYGLNTILQSYELFFVGGIAAVSEIIAKIIIYFIISGMKRASTIYLNVLLCLIVCLSFYSQNVNFLNITIRVCIMRFSSAVAYCIMSVYPNESFPTIMRSSGNGFVTSSGIIATILSPFLSKFLNNQKLIHSYLWGLYQYQKLQIKNNNSDLQNLFIISSFHNYLQQVFLILEPQ
ncbi:hypothetical protein pb186bvf_010006 [Paramecium bursaria]